MQIHIGRNNQQLGSFTVQQVLGGLASGQFLPTDIAWHEGLGDWEPLSSLAALNAAEPPPVAAAPPPVPQAIFQPQPAAQPMLQPTATSSLAGWSLGLGIGSFFFYLLTAIPAVICGHMALGRIKRSGGALGGSGLAITGLVLGYMMIASLPIIVSIAVPVFNVIQTNSIQAQSASNARQIIAACKLYAGDHGGSYPPDLQTLQKDGIITDDRILHCPILHDDTQIGYRYYGAGLKDTDPPDKVVVISLAAGRDGKRVVGHNDGSVETIVVPDLPLPR